MAGVELALAIVPLVIVLIEHHQTVFCKSRALTSSRISNEQQLEFYQDLHAELSLLYMTLNRVEIVSSRTELNRTQPASSPAQSIQSRLGSSADNFQQILDRVLKSIDDLVREDSSALTQADTEHDRSMLQKLRRFEQAIRNDEASNSVRARFRFARNEKTRNVAMKRIHNGVRNLERLLNSSMEIFNYRVCPSHQEFPANRTRRLPEALFKKMASKWPCSCNVLHSARLCLWNCCYVSDNSDDTNCPVDIIISTPSNERVPSQWQESTILIAGKQGNQVNENDHVELNVQSAGDQVPCTFSSAPPGRNIDSQSLCDLLQRAAGSNTCLQILFKNGILWQQRSKQSRLQNCHQSDASLKSLLGSVQRWQRYNLRDRLILSVILAHAVMHCSGGPWLHANLNKEHIFFFRNKGGPNPDISRPFLAIDFLQQQTVVDEEDDLFAIHSNPALLSLGILLLEINKKILIEDHWFTEDLADGVAQIGSTNLVTALRILEDMDGDMTVGSQRAVKACLEWDQANYGREDEDFATRMYELVVRPLEDALRHGFEITPEQLGLGERHIHGV